MKKNLAVMGSTGSIGTQTLDIVRENPALFNISSLTAGKNWELLAKQALEFRPKLVVIADSVFYSPLKEALYGSGVEVEAGHQALSHAATLSDVDIVVAALVGFSGLQSTLDAVKAGKQLALANKETLVVAGEIINHFLNRSGKKILPVDSEHSAIFQCLRGEDPSRVANIILTASGGPFRTWSTNDMSRATVADALKHPNWNMGSKVTLDSASMMNKGFEMIEARWLFDVAPEHIKILVHPQSVVHSMVEFSDGSIKAQLGTPDMRIPIGYALGFPDRLECTSRRLSLSDLTRLEFELPDVERFPLLQYAFDAIEYGGTKPAVLNAANEIAVYAFLNNKIKFTDIFDIVALTLSKVESVSVASLQDIFEAHSEASAVAEDLVHSLV